MPSTALRLQQLCAVLCCAVLLLLCVRLFKHGWAVEGMLLEQGLHCSCRSVPVVQQLVYRLVMVAFILLQTAGAFCSIL
jgi:hypothetical protein